MLTTTIFIRDIKNYFVKILLLLICLLPLNEAFKLLTQVSAGNLSYMAVLDLIIYGTIAAFPMIITIASFSAITIVTTSYCRNNYLIIYLTSGISLLDINKKILLFIIPLTFLALICSFFITPSIITKSDRYTKYLQNKYDSNIIKEGVFKNMPYTQNTYYIDSQQNHKVCYNIFIQYQDQHFNTYNLTAQQAKIEAMTPQQITMQLAHGNRNQVNDNNHITDISFEEAKLTVIPQYNIILNDDIRAYGIGRILKHLDQAIMRSELLWRISIGLMLINTSLIAFPLSINFSRKANNLHFVLIPLFYGIYQNLMYVLRAYTSNNYLHSMIWAFLLHLLIFIVALSLTVLKSHPQK